MRPEDGLNVTTQQYREYPGRLRFFHRVVVTSSGSGAGGGVDVGDHGNSGGAISPSSWSHGDGVGEGHFKLSQAATVDTLDLEPQAASAGVQASSRPGSSSEPQLLQPPSSQTPPLVRPQPPSQPEGQHAPKPQAARGLDMYFKREAGAIGGPRQGDGPGGRLHLRLVSPQGSGPQAATGSGIGAQARPRHHRRHDAGVPSGTGSQPPPPEAVLFATYNPLSLATESESASMRTPRALTPPSLSAGLQLFEDDAPATGTGSSHSARHSGSVSPGAPRPDKPWSRGSSPVWKQVSETLDEQR